MYACCMPCVWVRPEPYVKTKFLSLILLILLAELMNKKRGIVDIAFRTIYNLGPRSLMMVKF